jgi:hypothetical protein
VWVVRGRERDLLVDAGLGVASLRAAVDPLLSSGGRRLHAIIDRYLKERP